MRAATVAGYLPSAAMRYGREPDRAERLMAVADRAACMLGNFRSMFSSASTDAGSGIDRYVRLDDSTSLVFYLPRAFPIGFWAPFPNSWMSTGKRVGRVGKLLGC